MSSSGPSILFLTLYPVSAASPRYRVHQFLPALREAGLDCIVASALHETEWRNLTGPARRVRPFWYHFHETRRRIAQLLRARAYDVVFVQKALLTAFLPGLVPLLKSRARRVVYDMDDAVHIAPPHSLRVPWKTFEDTEQIKRIIRHADVVLAGNNWLADEVRALGGNAVYFPSVVDTDRFVPRERRDGRFCVGWIGNPSTMVCLKPALDALENLHDGELRLVGAAPNGIAPAHATIVPWTFDSEVAEIQQFSAGVMPLPHGDWMRGKCALKALQYMACGVPCIATPFGAATDVIADGETGLFAESAGDWRRAIDHLRDPAERARLGEAGRRHVEEHFSLNTAAPRMVEILTALSAS